MSEELDLDHLHGDEDDNNIVPPGTPPADPPAPQDPPAPPSLEPLPVIDGLEAYLSNFNIEGGVVTIDDENGQPIQKHYSELSPEQLYNVLNGVTNLSVQNYEAQAGLTEQELALLNTMRTNNLSFDTLLERAVADRLSGLQTLQDTATVDFTELSHEDIYRIIAKQENPNIAEADLEQDLETAKSANLFTKNMEIARQQFITEQKQATDNLVAEQQKIIDRQLEEDRATIVSSVQNMQHVAGFPLTDEMKNSVLSELLEVNKNNDPVFMEEVFANPENMFKAVWLFKHGESHIEALQNYYEKQLKDSYERGRRSAMEGLPSKPVSRHVPNPTPGVAPTNSMPDWESIHDD